MINVGYDKYSKRYYLKNEINEPLVSLTKEDAVKLAMELLKVAGVPNV